MAVTAFVLGVFSLRKEDIVQGYNWYFAALCFGCFIWCFSYAVLALLDDEKYAYFWRPIISVGVFFSLNMAIHFVGLWMEVDKKIQRIVSKYTLWGSLIIYPFITSGDLIRFKKASYGMTYTFTNLAYRTVFNIFLAILLVIVLIEIVSGLSKKRIQRRRIMAKVSLVCFALVIVGMIWDTILPMFNFYIFPGTAFATFIDVLIVYYVSDKYKVSTISMKNVSEFLLSAVNTPILVLNEKRKVTIFNAHSVDFFKIPSDQLINMSLTELFVFPKGMSYKNDEEHRYGISIDAECVNNGAKCNLGINYIYDGFNEKLGEIVVVTDMTKKIEVIQQLDESRQEAIAANKAKSAFLANMSHEIRTPLNTIIGMSEILLQKEELPESIQGELLSINEAGGGLLTIINDILDYSKMESGKFEIINVEYWLASLVTDITNQIAIRLVDKDVHLLVNIDSNVPMCLIGDDVRIKQILLNIMGNAVKFTNQGFISLHILAEKVSEEQCRIIFRVRDSGIGIKESDLSKLFGIFNQVDTKKNRKITGTGLGLAISKNLAESMGGTIRVQSTYGVGTTFVIEVLETIHKDEETFSVQNNELEKRYFLLYEENVWVIKSIVSFLRNNHLRYCVCTNMKELQQLIETKEFTDFIIQKNNLLRYVDFIYPLPHDIMIYELLSVGENYEAYHSENLEVYLPLFNIQMLSLLNNKRVSYQEKRLVSYHTTVKPMPYASILIVDDNRTNLQVAKGLMAAYKMTIHTAISGMEAIKLVKKRQYDLIFMDHMMPEMDGVDTVKEIRRLEGEYYKEVPIVALTANALSGAREKFLSMGFQDFLGKPIEFRNLDQILQKYVYQGKDSLKEYSDEEIVSQNDEPHIRNEIYVKSPCIDVERVLKYFDNNQSIYLSIVETFVEEMDKKSEEIHSLYEKGELSLLRIQVHAIKSASEGIGAYVLSKLARELEQACKSNQLSLIEEKLPVFQEEMSDVLYFAQSYIEERVNSNEVLQKQFRKEIDQVVLIKLIEACEEMEYSKMEELINQLCQYDYEKDLADLIECLLETFENFDYEGVLIITKRVRDYVNTKKEE